MFLRDVPDVVTAAELARTVDAIAEWQLPSGMIPWFPGGHADPWNHVEAAMALDLAGHRAKAERASKGSMVAPPFSVESGRTHHRIERQRVKPVFS